MLKTLAILAAIVGGAFAIATTGGALLMRRSRGAPANATDTDIDLLTTMGGTNFVSTADGFEGGRITTWSGGTECDLRNATLAPHGADIEVLNVFGGTDIRVPAGWDVTMDVNALYGVATGLSWIFYFRALQIGKASQVAPIDKLSLVLTVIFAAAFLGESMSWAVAGGVALIAAGTLIITLAG